MKNAAKLLQYAAASVIVGLVCGLFGCAYNIIQKYVVSIRALYSANIFLILLPFGGLLIVLVTKLLKTESCGTDDVIVAMRDSNKKTGAAFCASAFLSLSLTNLFETAMGREAAAFQVTTPVAQSIRSRFFKDLDPTIISSAAVAAGFSSIWGIPFFGAVFAAELAYGVLQWKKLIVCAVSSGCARVVSLLIFDNRTIYPAANLQGFDAALLIKIVILACACGLFARVHCLVLDSVGTLSEKIKNLYVRIFVLGAVVALLCFVLGNTDYLCGSNDIVNRALNGELVSDPEIYFAFALKLIIFAVALKAGYKVGRLSQTLAVGALFGELVGGVLLGMTPGLGALLGLICLLSAAYNVPCASLALFLEASSFSETFLLPAIICGFVMVAVSRLFSGSCKIYKAQELKLKL